MKAIILAAGVGSRLNPITDKKPKTMVTVNNKPMIDHIVDALMDADVTDIVVCVGYRGEQLRSHLVEKYSAKVNINFVENEKYSKTNNMYSLYLAREHLRGDVLLMNADLVFDSAIISGLKLLNGSAVAVDKGRYIEEAMKIVVERGVVKNISKKITPASAYGSSIDIYKLDARATDVLSHYIRRIIEDEKDMNQWTEVLLDRVFSEGLVNAVPYDIGTSRWFEIDNLDDLANAELLFNEKLRTLGSKTAFILDKDGTISIGSRPIAGAREFVEVLQSQKKKWVVASNNSSRTSSEHVEGILKIFGSGTKTEVISSLDFAIESLRGMEVKSLYWVANESVSRYLSNYFDFNSKNPDAVLLTYDTEINYDKITTAIRLIDNKVPYYATHIDMVCPVEDGAIPDIGSFIEMIAHCTSTQPLKTFGKPNKEFLEYVLRSMETEADHAVLIGDRIYTDIKSCVDSKVTSILVLSGETSRCDYEFSDCKADIVAPSIERLIEYIK